MRGPRSLSVLLLLAGCGDDARSTDGGENDARGDGQASSCAPKPGWIAAPALARGPTQETATVALDGKIYVVGGFDDNFTVLDTVQVFDTASCVWSAGPALPRAVHHANVAVHEGTVWLVGAMETINFTAVGHVWSWNPATESAWQLHPAMPAGQERGAAVTAAIGDRIFVAGGLRGGSVAQFSSFTPATGAWDTLPMLPMVRDHGCGGAVGGTLYVTGGRAAALQSQVYAYTPGGAWELEAPMPTARGGTACGVDGERIIVVGGEGNSAVASGVFPNVESYLPSTNTWTQHEPMATPRHGMGAAMWGGALYVPGGATVQAFGAVDTHEILMLQ